MKVLLAGDVHIGRSSSRLPEGVGRDDLRSATAWNRIVDLAIREHVAVVCLSGDIADQDNKFFEAIGPLERGVRRLADANIRTVAVAGNHDYDVLLRLAGALPDEHFTLLGRGGIWQRLTIEDESGPALHIDGWSFPTERVHRSPLYDYGLPRDPALPILGMVHGDLDVATSPYAPLELGRLQALVPTAWLLGHIHAPRLIPGPPWVLYPGSPQALDPGEPGPHGAWIVEVVGGQIKPPQSRPLSSVWYERLTVDLSAAKNEADLESLLLEALRAEAVRIGDEAGPDLVHARLRLTLAGHTAVSHRVSQIARRLVEDLALPTGGGSLTVEAAVDVQTLPAIDLSEYAQMQSAPGAVARMLLELDRDEISDEVAQLIGQTRNDLQRLEQQKDYVPLDRREVTEAMAREHLVVQGRALLTELVTQTP